MPLEEILKNSVSLSYFLDFLSSQDLQGFLLFLLSIEGMFLKYGEKKILYLCYFPGWKGSVVQELDKIDQTKEKSGKRQLPFLIKDAAQNILEQYLLSHVIKEI